MAKSRKPGAEPAIETLVGMLPAKQPHTPPFSQRLGVASFRSWVYAAVRVNAQQVAATPLRLYTRKRNGTKLYRTRATPRGRLDYLLGERDHAPSVRTVSKLMDFGADFEEVTEQHPALDLLRRVNPWLGGFDLLSLTVIYAELTGNWYWYPVPGQFGPSEVWVLPSQWTTIVPDRTQFVAGYLFGRTQAEAVMFTPEEVLHGKYPNPGDPFYGLGKVEAGWGVVQKNAAMQNMDLAMFQNMARPDYAIIVKSGASAAEIEAFSKQVREKVEGVKKAGRFIAVSGDIAFQPLNFSPKDVTGRELTIEEIAAVFGVPVSMLRANEPNLASAEVGYASWREMTILPICRMLEDFLNQRLLPMYGIEDDACFAFDDPVPRNRAEDRAEAESLLRTGQNTLNERREALGLPPFSDPMADVPLVNNQPLGYTAPAPVPFAGPAAPMRNNAEDEDEPEPIERMKAVPTPPVALLTTDAAPREPSELDRVRAMVKSHNAAHPESPITEAEAIEAYERSLSVTTDDVMAELLDMVKASLRDDADPTIDILLRELHDAA